MWNKAQLTQVATGVTTCSTGDDVLVAQTSNQTLTGNGGNDQYVVGLNKSTTIVDNSSNLDTVQHGKLIVGLDESNIWLSQSGDDLLVQALNSADLVDIKNWFTGIGNQLASLQTHDGYKVSDISGLVSAMSAYSSANPSFSVGSTVMPNDTILQSALTNSWHK